MSQPSPTRNLWVQEAIDIVDKKTAVLPRLMHIKALVMWGLALEQEVARLRAQSREF